MNRLFAFLLIWFCFCLNISPLHASTGIVTYSSGEVRIANKYSTSIAKTGTILPDEFTIESSDKNQIKLIFRDGSEFIIYENSKVSFKIDRSKNTDQITIEHLEGVIWSRQIPTGWKYYIKYNNSTVFPEKSSYKLTVTPEGNLKQLYVFDGKVRVQPKDKLKTRQINALKGARLLFNEELQVENIPEKLKVTMTSAQNVFFLPGSGQMEAEVSINISGSPENSFDYSNMEGTLVSDNHNLLIPNPKIKLKAQTTKVKVFLIGTGEPTLYFILDPLALGIGGEGKLSFLVLEAGHPKVLRIKTTNGNIKINLVPKPSSN